MTNHRIQQLDTLIPMLGYDWKENKTKPREIISFEKHIDLLKMSLKESITLTRKQKSWLYSQRALYIKQPEKFEIEKIKLLNSLNDDLGYVWNKLKRPPKKKTPYKQHIKEIQKRRQTGENLTKPQLLWLQGNRSANHILYSLCLCFSFAICKKKTQNENRKCTPFFENGRRVHSV